jgi:2-succinyl-5-enolpyruvyl-6-hydroxy-3-cyclohexene-1-carboxylate synthase
MNSSTANARSIVERCLAHGAKHVVIAPGSRSAPLSWAFAQAAKAGALEIHVRIDERDAGFLALGLAKASKTPVPVVVTSGSAVANLMPAVVEAFQSGIPLIVLSADRPASARGHGAPQTIDQVGMFGKFATASVDLTVGQTDVSQIDAALARSLTAHGGPVQINVQLDMPLMPDEADMNWQPNISRLEISKPVSPRESLNVPANGLLVLGDNADPVSIGEAGELATQLGWPVIWEPSANAHSLTNALSHGVLLLASGKLPTPEMVITVGSVGLSRAVLKLIKDVPEHIAVHLNSAGPEIPDPVSSAKQVITAIPTALNSIDPSWLEKWHAADLVARAIVESELSAQTLTGPSAAVEVWNKAANDETLFVAASWPVRHLEAYASARSGLRVLGNRGANGIDGLISTAWGVARETSKRTYLLIGDVAFLHDLGGLNVSETETQPPLTIVVLDNDGSGIFSQLEQGAPLYREHYESVFGTPHGKDLWVIAESLGIPAKRVTTKSELEFALQNAGTNPGVNVIVCTTGNRDAEFEIIKSIAGKVSDSL